MGGSRRGTGAPTPSADASLAGLVPRAARNWPSDVGLVGDGVEMTWQQIEVSTRRLARALLDAGIGRGDRVAVARRKTHESFIAVHGILRAGATMVPVDPLAPPLISRQVLHDAGVRAVVGDRSVIGALDPWTAVSHELVVVLATESDPSSPATAAAEGDERIVAMALLGDGSLDTCGASAGLPGVGSDDVAYIIYTSGSTGRPKGIVHTHRSGLEYARRAVAEYRLGPDERLAGMNPLHFDMSTLELYAAPLAGCTTVVMSESDLQFPAGLTQRSAEHDVSMWYSVPFLLRGVVARGGLDRRPLPALRSVLYGGEPYPPGALRELMAALPAVTVTNVYGPAEVNACSHHHIDDSSEIGTDVPIGRPWDGVEVAVVDEDGQEVPRGQPGELWVAAPTVMTRYWGLDELTSEKLRPRTDGPPWYATGDIVKLDDDGILWFEGRSDHQVKVRGVRLELEAIERILDEAPSVAHAVVGPYGPSGNASHIVAAVVYRDDAAPDPAPLRHWCRERLPSVAVPREISAWTDMPTTASGKLDRKAVRAKLRSGDAREDGQS